MSHFPDCSLLRLFPLRSQADLTSGPLLTPQTEVLVENVIELNRRIITWKKFLFQRVTKRGEKTLTLRRSRIWTSNPIKAATFMPEMRIRTYVGEETTLCLLFLY